MVYPLDITSEEWSRIEEAKQLGINVDAFLRGAIASLPAPNQNGGHSIAETGNGASAKPMPQLRPTQSLVLPEYTKAERQAAVDFFREQSENPLTDAEEIQMADADFAELMRNLQEWR